MKSLKIKKYDDKYQKEFKKINLYWLKKFELYEKSDDQLLDNPEEFINNGATIFLAHVDDIIVGTICLNPVDSKTFEILKFAVIDGYKGLGIGTKLLQTVIDLSKQKNVEKVVLESSSKLQNALKLYKKYGFEHIEVKETHFVTADIKMELKLK